LPGSDLRRLVWDPLQPKLKECETIIVIPDGVLANVPWGALPSPDGDSFLVEKYAFGTAADGQQVYELLSKPAVTESDAQLLVVGGVRYDMRPNEDSRTLQLANRGPVLRDGDKPRWSFLPGTKQEVDGVRALWAGDTPPTVFTSTEANERAVGQALTTSRFIHLATHGFFTDPGPNPLRPGAGWESVLDTGGYAGNRSTLNYRNPLILCGLVLAGANAPLPTDDAGLPLGDDGVLTGEEIAELDLREAEMVVLSACETGLGDIADGEGVFGLQRAFALAGARTVIASLWQVDDSATQALMTEFYTNLWTRGMGKLAALREAQLTMMRRYDPVAGRLRGLRPIDETGDRRVMDPSLWAAFVLNGDWR
jgi:CHAT domain-containing protein